MPSGVAIEYPQPKMPSLSPFPLASCTWKLWPTVVADLRYFLLPGFFAFGVGFVISFRLLNNAFTLLIRPVFTGGSGCLLVANNVFTLLIRPVFAGGAGCLLFLIIADFLFRWLVAGTPICLYVRVDEIFT